MNGHCSLPVPGPEILAADAQQTVDWGHPRHGEAQNGSFQSSMASDLLDIGLKVSLDTLHSVIEISTTFSLLQRLKTKPSAGFLVS